MYLPEPTVQSILAAVKEKKVGRDESVMILLAEEHSLDISELIEVLSSSGISFFGGVFPGLIYGEKSCRKGALVLSVPIVEKPFLISGLEEESFSLPQEWENIHEQMEKKYTALIMVDGLAANISLFLMSVFNKLGNAVNYLGGGAGSLSLEQKPCIFTEEGFFLNAAVVCFIRWESCLGVQHGWELIKGPLIATRTQKNVVAELNWEPAFSVYRRVVEMDSKKMFAGDNFFEIAKGYPFGILKEGAENIVRDPIAVNERGELVCVGEVPENTVLGILKGSGDSLLNAAVKAATECIPAMGKDIKMPFVIDCISRVLFLEEAFDKEVGAVKEVLKKLLKNQPLQGILSLGEISSSGEGFLEFFNKTIVVGVLYE
ncbi:MAG: FIST C-terminal domain-containing protein [Peptococcaceae bacterium]|jgi:hypothetical protein|nr:FIST C-terminal domain-containing protein [Peptococcaceae bacterium]MDH7526335.1 FIST C-terminal domain-containing protein [Peptococcaceae bacterium]